MEDETQTLPWEAPGWLEEVSNWIQDRLADHGLSLTQPIELIHQRPWSAFARGVTGSGVVYFKEPAPAFKFETALTHALASWRPDCMVRLLGADPERGWMLSADAGVTLRSLSQSPDQIEHWLRILPLYVELQMEMAGRVPELLALDLTDRRLDVLPDQFDRLLEETDNLRIGRDPGLTDLEYRRLLELRPNFRQECDRLRSYGLPETLVHEEIHENNVLLGDRGYIFTDWSDSSLSHPLFSMLVTLRSIAHWLKLDESGPDVRKVRDAYLEPWTKLATRQELDAAASLAYSLAMVVRALSWDQGTGSLSPRHKEAYADSVPGWLQDYLEA